MDLYRIAFIIIIFGGIDWGFVGLLKFDIISGIFGEYSVLSRLLYLIIGAAAAYIGAKIYIFKDDKTSKG